MREFLDIAAQIVERDPDLRGCRPVVEKELLHVEILTAMNAAGHLRHLTFKGGTCLRLCHGAVRFSEDLDFSGGKAFGHVLLDDIGDVLRDRIGRQYELEVTVSAPKLANETRTANRWVARIVARPSNSNARLGVQRIKIEVDDRESPSTSAPKSVYQHYKHVIGHYAPLVVRSVPLEDICSDKLIAFPMSVAERQNPRYRDVWDVLWIVQQIRNVDAIMQATKDKAESRGLGDRFNRVADGAANRMDAIVNSDAFGATLRRFLRESTAAQTIGDPDYREYMVSTMKSLLLRVRDDSPSAPSTGSVRRGQSGVATCGRGHHFPAPDRPYGCLSVVASMISSQRRPPAPGCP